MDSNIIVAIVGAASALAGSLIGGFFPTTAPRNKFDLKRYVTYTIKKARCILIFWRNITLIWR